MTGNRCHRKIIFYVEHFLLKQSLRIIKIEASASMFLAKWGSCCMFRTPGSKSKKETKPPLSVKVCKAFVCSLRKRKRKERNHSHCKPIIFGCFKLVFILALKWAHQCFGVLSFPVDYALLFDQEIKLIFAGENQIENFHPHGTLIGSLNMMLLNRIQSTNGF